MTEERELLHLTLRRQQLSQDEGGRTVWTVRETTETWPARQTALLLCDVWDRHWSRGATERLEAMVPRMNRVVQQTRTRGVVIIHAPSDTMEFYANSPARRRVLDVPRTGPPRERSVGDRPLPIDASDQGSDTGETKPFKAWTRQHPGIEVNEQEDAVSADGREVYSFMQHRGINNLLIMGVHTNMCVLARSFAIKQMVRWGVNVALIRDLTDTMYNPAMPPYVPHGEGTQLVVAYIEKFWCPTLVSDDLLVT